MCQHLEGDITLHAWLATCISLWLQKRWASRTGLVGRTDAWVHISTMGWNGGPCCASLSLRLLCWCPRCEFVSYRLSSKLWWIVVNVSDSDDSGGCVGEAVHGVALHVSGLDDQGVLRHFLEGERREKQCQDLYKILRSQQYKQWIVYKVKIVSQKSQCNLIQNSNSSHIIYPISNSMVVLNNERILF